MKIVKLPRPDIKGLGQLDALIAGYYFEQELPWWRRLWPQRKYPRAFQLFPDYPTFAVSQLMPEQHFYYGTQEDFLHMSQVQEKNPEIEKRDVVACVGAMITQGPLQSIIVAAPRPARHHNLWAYLEEYGVTIQARATVVQGFLSAKGYWLTRQQAFKMAREMNQIVNPTVFQPGQLYSENLWVLKAPRNYRGDPPVDPHGVNPEPIRS